MAERYIDRSERAPRPRHEIWQPLRRPRRVGRGQILRFQIPAPFSLRWSLDDWETVREDRAHDTPLGFSIVDIPIPVDQDGPLRAAIHWTDTDEWTDEDEVVAVE
ncbi:MAG: hypothetical protein ACOCXJ_06290 [Planctomycetota bacterium]